MAEKKTKPAGAESAQVAAIREAWHSLYTLGDDALTRAQAALKKHDMDAFFEAQTSFDKVREALRKLTPVSDTAFVGRKFMDGRKVGTVGPIRKMIARLLKKNPKAKNAELWAAVKAKPPKGWAAFDSPRLGKYLEGPSNENMGYPSFLNAASIERGKLKG